MEFRAQECFEEGPRNLRRRRKAELDQLMNIYNATVSDNYQKRERVDSLRKERTLIDQLFKELECDLIIEEGTLFDLLIRNQEVEDDLKELDVMSQEMLAVTRKKETGSFLIAMNEQKTAYETLAKEVDNKRRKKKDYTYSSESDDEKKKSPAPKRDVKFLKKFLLSSIRKATRSNSFMSAIQTYQKQKRVETIEFLEKSFVIFKQKAEGFDIDKISKVFKDGDKRNEQLFKEHYELEAEVS